MLLDGAQHLIAGDLDDAGEGLGLRLQRGVAEIGPGGPGEQHKQTADKDQRQGGGGSDGKSALAHRCFFTA